MFELLPGYNSEIDTMDATSWTNVISQFDDVNIYQTWEYDEARCGSRNMSHMVLKRNNMVVAVAQARIIKVPPLNIGVAYIRWGPLWRKSLNDINEETFSQSVRALHNEYVCKRGFLLRIYPLLYSDNSSIYHDIFTKEGFTKASYKKSDRTFIVDLNRPFDELRKGLAQKWRNCLNAADKNNLEIISGSNDELFEEFRFIYSHMLKRKKLFYTKTFEEFREIQKKLPDELKLQVFICKYGGISCAGAICSAISKIGIYLFGATDEVAMKNKSAYLIQWSIIQWLKNKSSQFYDLHGVNPETNPGTYRFKKGLCGKNGREVYLYGYYDSCDNPIYLFVMTTGERFMSLLKSIRLFHSAQNRE